MEFYTFSPSQLEAFEVHLKRREKLFNQQRFALLNYHPERLFFRHQHTSM